MKLPIVILLLMIFVSSCAGPMSAGPGSTPSPAPVVTSSPAQGVNEAPASSIPSGSVHLEPFGTLNIDPAEIRFNLDGTGKNVDSISFWEAPDPADSLMIVTSKGNHFNEVYRYPFQSELTSVACGQESNGVWVDQERDVLYITERKSDNVCAYNLPSLGINDALSFATAATKNKSEPNLAMLTLPDGQRRLYVSYDDKVYYHDAETGKSLGQFTPRTGLETMVGDDYYQVLYIPDENGRSGVYIYDPNGSLAGTKFGDSSIFDQDEEGILIYKCLSKNNADTGEGLIVISDQKDDQTDFEVFNRRTREYLGKINISGVNNTDGIASIQQASPTYPAGLFAVIDDDTSTVGVGWDTIFEKAGLSCGS